MSASPQQKVLDDLLIEAVRAKDVTQAKLYVQKGADVNVVLDVQEYISTPGGSSYTKTGAAPLVHLAAHPSYYSGVMLSFLKSQGADIDAKNFKGNTPLMLAVKSGTLYKIKYCPILAKIYRILSIAFWRKWKMARRAHRLHKAASRPISKALPDRPKSLVK